MEHRAQLQLDALPLPARHGLQLRCPTRRQERWTFTASRSEDTAASALLLKHEFLDGGADDVTLEPTLTTLGNFLVRSNSQSSVALPASRWEASSWRATP